MEHNFLAGRDGKNGKDGKDGRNGRNGRSRAVDQSICRINAQPRAAVPQFVGRRRRWRHEPGSANPAYSQPGAAGPHEMSGHRPDLLSQPSGAIPQSYDLAHASK